MRKPVRSYTSFTRTERIGLLCLCAVLIILITIRATMSFWIHPATDPKNEERLVKAWEAFKKSQPAYENDTDRDFKNAGEKPQKPLADTTNINRLSETGSFTKATRDTPKSHIIFSVSKKYK